MIVMLWLSFILLALVERRCTHCDGPVMPQMMKYLLGFASYNDREIGFGKFQNPFPFLNIRFFTGCSPF
eukprot:scaffold470_cov194-Amphora_coffeaeformis.AAC.7